MSLSLTRRIPTALAAAGALLAAALAIAPQAHAATLYACVKKNGTARVFTKKQKCRKGERRLSWSNVGPAGKNGANGANGAAGKNGANGADGAPGQPQRGLAFATALDWSPGESKLVPLFSTAGVTVRLNCEAGLAAFGWLEASAPEGSRAETGMVVTNEKGEAPGLVQEPIGDVALGGSFAKFVRLTSNTSGPPRNVAHVNGSIVTPSALVLFDAYMSVGLNPEGCIVRGGAIGVPL